MPRDSAEAESTVTEPPGWQLLDAATRITRQKDRARVDEALLDAMSSLWGVRHGVLYQLVDQQPVACRALVTLDDGQVGHQECGACEPLAAIPGAEQSVRRRRVTAWSGPRGAHVLYPISNRYFEPVRLLKLCADTLKAEDRSLQAILTLYENHVSLIDDSEHDTLTGLRNRRTFDHTLALLAAKAREGVDLGGGFRRNVRAPDEISNWLAVMDIDRFKSINDRYGHLFGDEVLILLANLMRRSFRANDTAFRFGGEEFVIVLRDTDRFGASTAVERFRDLLASQSFPRIGRITISAGYTEIEPGALPSDILNRADAALYQAKDDGRNRCYCYEELLETGALAPVAVTSETDVELF